jgi:hypothetical protein
MNTKKRRRTAQDDRRSKPQAASSSKHGEKMSIDPIYVLETIGVEGEPTLEEWNYLRNAGYDELEKYNIPPNLVEAVRGFRPHASVRWLNEKGEPASPNDRMVEAVLSKTSRSATFGLRKAKVWMGKIELLQTGWHSCLSILHSNSRTRGRTRGETIETRK